MDFKIFDLVMLKDGPAPMSDLDEPCLPSLSSASFAFTPEWLGTQTKVNFLI